MENYLYFAEADVNTGGAQTTREGLMVPASKYVGADPVGDDSTKFMFESIEGLDEGMTNIVLTHGAGNNKKVIRAFMASMNATPTTGFVVMADSDVAGASKNAEYSPAFEGDVSTVVITETKDSSVLAATHGAGAIGTSSFGAPQTRRWIENGSIVTEIKIDLTGLTAHGATANDVIGIKTAAPDAYLIQHDINTMGIVFKTEMYCIETPAGAGSLNDINAVWASSGTLGYSEAGGTVYGINGDDAAWAAGNYLEAGNQVAPTDDHFLYLTEDTTDGDDTPFTAGQFVIKIHGTQTLA
jgi:hypothetical protein